MPHLISSTTTDVKQAAMEPAPFGPGFPDHVATKAARMDITGSSFKDGGGDWTEFTLFDAAGQKIASRQMGGY